VVYRVRKDHKVNLALMVSQVIPVFKDHKERQVPLVIKVNLDLLDLRVNAVYLDLMLTQTETDSIHSTNALSVLSSFTLIRDQ
jgi:hypothetical protein